LRLDIGIVDVMPKVIAQLLIEPALHLRENVRVVCREATSDNLLARLATHELDLVLSDSPVDPSLSIRAYSHLLGECGVIFVSAPKLANKFRKGFPKSLDGAPLFLPTENTALRRALELWFERQNVRPMVVGEFEDYALLRAFGETGTAIFPMPSVFEKQPDGLRGLSTIGHTDKVKMDFYAISAERKLQHPAVVAISNAARRELFK
jgi:LysR family transcriptional activator of nhaA